MKSFDILRISKALEESWSLNSSSKWKKSNPALGQCGVTALVAHDYLGGEIVKTKVVKQEVGELWHYYNLLEKNQWISQLANLTNQSIMIIYHLTEKKHF